MPTDKGYRNTYSSGGKSSTPVRSGPKRTTSAPANAPGGDYKHSWNAMGPGYGGVADLYRGQVGQNQTQQGWNAFRNTYAMGDAALPMGAAPGSPMIGGGGGGGGGWGRGGGGGGGGGGGSALTQAMFDQMVAALGRQGQPLAATQLNLPAFQGQNIAAFNAAPYQQAQQSLNQAVAADRANVNTNAQNTTNTLQSNFTNDYANAQVTPGQTMAPVGASLQATAGAPVSNDPNQQAAAQANGANGDSQAAFGNLLKVLAANAQQGQASRLNQVQMDRGTAQNAIGAQNLGLGAGINQAKANAQNQWSQQDNERRYQNSLMAQQWQREQAMQNNQMTNQTAQANWQQRNQQMQSTLQPILDLIASTGGAKGINMQTLTALLGRQ